MQFSTSAGTGAGSSIAPDGFEAQSPNLPRSTFLGGTKLPPTGCSPGYSSSIHLAGYCLLTDRKHQKAPLFSLQRKIEKRTI